MTDSILDTAPCGFISFADDGIVLDANKTLLETLGYARDSVVGKPIEHILPIGTRIFYQTHWFPLLRLHGHAEEVFLMLRDHTGATIGMLSYASRRDDLNGAYHCILVQVRERAKYEHELLRAKKEAEESNRRLEEQAVELELQQQQLQEQTARLERLRATADEANQAKSTFLAMMSHELRTPLNAIGGYLQILSMQIAGPLTERQIDILGRLEKSAAHLLSLINDVLSLARIESGVIDYEITDAKVRDLVLAVTPMIEPQLAAKSIKLEVDLGPELFARVDVEKMHQILLNLLSNATKFTQDGGTVRVGASGSGELVCIDVADTGIGIPASQIEAIFHPFVQVDDKRTRSQQGSGLGLAISRDLARGMGGDLSVKTEIGVGSTFTLRVPAALSSALDQR